MTAEAIVLIVVSRRKNFGDIGKATVGKTLVKHHCVRVRNCDPPVNMPGLNAMPGAHNIARRRVNHIGRTTVCAIQLRYACVPAQSIVVYGQHDVVLCVLPRQPRRVYYRAVLTRITMNNVCAEFIGNGIIECCVTVRVENNDFVDKRATL